MKLATHNMDLMFINHVFVAPQIFFIHRSCHNKLFCLKYLFGKYMPDAIQLIANYAGQGAVLRESFFKNNAENIRNAAFQTALALAKGGRLFLCANGEGCALAEILGSAFINPQDKPSLPVYILTGNTSMLSSMAAAEDYELIFCKQIEALAQAGDILLFFSSASQNRDLLLAAQTALQMDIFIIGLTGGSSTHLHQFCKILINVETTKKSLILEQYFAFANIFPQLVNLFLYENVRELKPYLIKDI